MRRGLLTWVRRYWSLQREKAFRRLAAFRSSVSSDGRFILTPREGSLMRPLLTALLLIALLGAAGYYLFQPQAQTSPFLRETQAAFSEAQKNSVERTADWWLNAAERQKAGENIRGSGVALALAIRVGRAEALQGEVHSLPKKLRRRFAPHFPDELPDGVRWTVAEPGTRLGRALARWPVSEGAVTLGNVVVFKTDGASRNTRLFAHEIAHVAQYRKLGIDTFARRYAANPKQLEDEAWEKADRVVG